MLKQYKLKNYKFILVLYVVALTVIGILLIGSAKPSVQNKQIFGMVLSLAMMLIVSLIDYNFILRFAWLIYLFMAGMLLLVLAVGKSAGGAQRWIQFPGRISVPAFRTGKDPDHFVFCLFLYEI